MRKIGNMLANELGNELRKILNWRATGSRNGARKILSVTGKAHGSEKRNTGQNTENASGKNTRSGSRKICSASASGRGGHEQKIPSRIEKEFGAPALELKPGCGLSRTD